MALSMFDDANELPISSDLHGVEMDNVKSKKETLEKKRESILAEIVSLLGNRPLVSFAAATFLIPFIKAAVRKSQLLFSDIFQTSSKDDVKTSTNLS